jgi:ubiquinone/menaquinone biosynthesis C-methylase UbiE
VFKRCVVDEREQKLIMGFQAVVVSSLRDKRILEVGAGGGSLIRHLFDFGAAPEKCFGIELNDESLKIAKRLTPAVGFAVANGGQIPFPDESFDVALQFMVLTAILDPEVRRVVISEILRTLRKGGVLAWYDFCYDSPRNPNVRGIGRREVRELLPGCRLRFWGVTLAPPIGRVAARVSPFFYQVLAQIPWLRTHCLCIAEKM